MQTSNLPMILSKVAQEAVISFHYQCYSMMNQQYQLRAVMRDIDLAYIRENDWTMENVRARLANQYGDSDRYQNITVPVVKPQVETSVVYQASVFLTGVPLFGVVADPAYMSDALQMETVVDQNAIMGGWKRQLMMHFRNGFKYNLAALEICWARKTTAAFETDLKFSASEAKPKEVTWEGNSIRNLDMYNTFFDTRVEPCRMHEDGEFAGYSELMGRVALKKFIQELPDRMVDNVTKAFEAPFGGWGVGGVVGGPYNYYLPPINPHALVNKNQFATVDWMMWAGLGNTDKKINYGNLYEVTTLYARILPSDFGLRVPSPNTPQVWKFIIINHQIVIYAERQTNAHGWLPIIFSQPSEDGLKYQTKSAASDALPFQSVESALANSAIASRRRAISDRVLYDPSMIDHAHINSANPSAKIPVRPSAYGKDISKSVYAFPFRDDQSGVAFSEIQTFDAMADKIMGHNKAQQGLFVKGNKTRHEYDSVMANAAGRDQLCSLLLEDQLFMPLKHIIKLNILQYQGAASYYSRATKENVNIDPVKLRNAALEFKVSDGLVPSDKLANSEAMSVGMQQIGSSGALQAEYDLGGLFSFLMKTQGAQIEDFQKPKEQVAYEAAVNAWQQQGATMMEMFKIAAPTAAKDTPLPEVIKMIQGMLPPQPTPEQFGYNPNPKAPVKSTQPQQSTEPQLPGF